MDKSLRRNQRNGEDDFALQTANPHYIIDKHMFSWPKYHHPPLT